MMSSSMILCAWSQRWQTQSGPEGTRSLNKEQLLISWMELTPCAVCRPVWTGSQRLQPSMKGMQGEHLLCVCVWQQIFGRCITSNCSTPSIGAHRMRETLHWQSKFILSHPLFLDFHATVIFLCFNVEHVSLSHETVLPCLNIQQVAVKGV